jgi:glycosyltransferase involved in cell wall biosynthesis
MPEIIVSAIIPTYNRADLVGRAVQSALDQRVPNGDLEVIVVDDESTDATPDVLAGFGSSIRTVRQTNRREGAARNVGASIARGDYVAFLDSDDYWLPGKLAADVARFEAADRPALVYSRALNVDSLDRPIGIRRLPVHEGDVFWRLAREAFMPMSTVAVRADAFGACGGFEEDRALSGTADWELWLRMAARWPVGFVEQTATCIRVHPRRMLADHRYMEGAMLAGVRHALADPVVAQRARGRERAIWAWMYVTIALNAYLNGRRRQSWQWLGRALVSWPPQLLDSRVWGAATRFSLGPAALARLKTARDDGKRLPGCGKRLPVSAYGNG